jgi:IS605 OrfB family transposase
MNNKVLKTEDFLKKTGWQRKTYPLKLNLLETQEIKLMRMIEEYKKIINFAIQLITKDFFPNYLEGLSEPVENKCPLCQKKKKLRFKLKDFEFVKYGETKGKPNYKPIYKKGNETNICEMCHCSHYSLRKFVLPSSKREIPISKWDITKISNFKAKNVYDSALQKAVETIKSQYEIKKKINWKINMLRNRILNNQVELNKKKGDNYEKYGDKLKKFIKRDERQIEKEKKKKAEDILYKNDAIRLYENTYELIKEDDDYYIKIKDYIKGKWMTLEFYGENYQKKLADKFINSKNAETEIIKRKDNFYLQYIYRKEINVPVPDKTFTAVGIDVNIINLASYVSMDKSLKLIAIKFYSGRDMRARRKRFKQVRKIWQGKTKYKSKGGKGRAWKWYLNKQKAQNEKDYVKYQIHKLTTHIIQEIKDTIEKPVIVIENLKDIRNRIGKELKITKCSIEKLNKNQQKAIRGDKLLNSELNNWNFDDFQKFIEYKANWFGIPVVKAPAKDTSIKCNKCGHTEEENYKDYHTVSFECRKCGYKCNSDFNASVNIARSFFQKDSESK